MKIPEKTSGKTRHAKNETQNSDKTLILSFGT